MMKALQIMALTYPPFDPLLLSTWSLLMDYWEHQQYVQPPTCTPSHTLCGLMDVVGMFVGAR